MALSGEPAASETMVPSRHRPGPLLGYVLAPRVAWDLCFMEVVEQVLQENREQNERRQREASSSLNKCHSRRTRFRDELDAVSKALEAISDKRACKDHGKRLAAIQTSLGSVEASISKFENIIKECRMVEDEVCQIEEAASQDQPDSGDEADDIEMADQEASHHLESSDSHMEASTEDQPLSATRGSLISPEEEVILMGGASQSEDCNPASKTASVSGGMAELHLASPSHSGPEEEETPP